MNETQILDETVKYLLETYQNIYELLIILVLIISSVLVGYALLKAFFTLKT